MVLFLKRFAMEINDSVGVSVITPLYNYVKYIRENIESVKKSGDKSGYNYEHIVVDDCSSDNPYNEIEKSIHDKLIYIKREKNGGMSASRNTGIKKSKYCFVCFLDADDKLTKTSLKDRVDMLLKGYDFVHGPVWSCCDRKQSINKEWNEWEKMSKTKDAYRFIHAQSVCCRKDLFKKYGMFDENLIWKADRELWARLINRNIRIGTVDNPVAHYRSHNKQWSKHPEKLKNNKRLTEELKKLIEERRTNLYGLEFLNNE